MSKTGSILLPLPQKWDKPLLSYFSMAGFQKLRSCCHAPMRSSLLSLSTRDTRAHFRGLDLAEVLVLASFIHCPNRLQSFLRCNEFIRQEKAKAWQVRCATKEKLLFSSIPRDIIYSEKMHLSLRSDLEVAGSSPGRASYHVHKAYDNCPVIGDQVGHGSCD